MPAALIFRLARTSRWAIVASGTSSARAISGVVSPPSVRSVSATCASVASDGWQHVNTSSSRSSGMVASSMSSSTASGTSSSRVFAAQRLLAADAVDRAVARGGHEPRARVRGRALARPALRGDRERLLRGLLGEVEVAEEADQRGDDAPPLIAEGLLEGSYHSCAGRISIAPPSRAAGTREATSIAASRSSASKMK